MFVFTMTAKRGIKIGFIAVCAIAAAAVGVNAVVSNLTSGAQEQKRPVSSVERDDGRVALTFDTQWAEGTVSGGNTDTILDVLASEGVPATFFVTGDFASKYPEVVRSIYSDGHEIGNGSNKYPKLIAGKGETAVGINEFIEDTNTASQFLKRLTGEMPKVYRAPYGEYTDESITTLDGMGLIPVKWSKDSSDTKEPEPAVIVKRVTKGVKSGDIILLHSDIANTAKALPEIITALKAQGLSFGTVSDIVYHSNYTVNSEGRQIGEPAARAGLSFEQEAAAVAAVSKARLHLTPSEFEKLRNGVTDPGIVAKVSSVLTHDEVALLSSLDPTTVSRIIDAATVSVSANLNGDVPVNTADTVDSGDVYGEKGGISADGADSVSALSSAKRAAEQFGGAVAVGGYDSAGDYQKPGMIAEAPTEAAEVVPQIEPAADPAPAGTEPEGGSGKRAGNSPKDRAEMTTYTDRQRAEMTIYPDDTRPPVRFIPTSNDAEPPLLETDRAEAGALAAASTGAKVARGEPVSFGVNK
ncbi:hypothetical protein FACS1894120_0640 [Clostridia bacterium]|nr:hypothetical protein FACS1894120_0640 [Clostridia bacterium]